VHYSHFKEAGLNDGDSITHYYISRYSWQKEKSFDLHVLLPGLEKDNVNLEIEGNKLIVSGERKQQATEENEKYHQVESFYGKFRRSFNLPKNVNTESIKAGFKNGILEISIEKTEPAKTAKAIEIQ